MTTNTTTTIDPVTQTLIKINERVRLSPDTVEILRKLLQAMYLQGRDDGQQAYFNSEYFEIDAEQRLRDKGWRDPDGN